MIILPRTYATVPYYPYMEKEQKEDEQYSM